MTEAIDELMVKITADWDELKKALNSAENKTDSFSKKWRRSMDKANAAVKKYTKLTIMAGGAVGTLAAVTGGALVKSNLAVIDSQAKMAKTLNLTIQAMREMGLAAELNGSSMEEMNRSMRVMDRRLGFAVDGMGAAKSQLDLLNLSAQELVAMDVDVAWRKIAEEIGKLPSQGERAAAAMNILGDESGRLLNLIEAGPAAFDEARIAISRFGGALSGEEAARVEKFNDDIAKLSAGATNLSQRFTANLAPALSVIVEDIEEFVGTGENAVKVLEDTGDAAAFTWATFKQGATIVNTMVQTIQTTIMGISATFWSTVEGVSTAYDYWNKLTKRTVDFIAETFNLLGAGVDVVWANIAGRVKSTMGEIVGSVAGSTAKMLRSLRDAAESAGMTQLEEQLRASAHGMGVLERSTKQWGAQSVAATQEVMTAFDRVQKSQSQAASALFDQDIEGQASEFVTDMAEAARSMFGEQAEEMQTAWGEMFFGENFFTHLEDGMARVREAMDAFGSEQVKETEKREQSINSVMSQKNKDRLSQTSAMFGNLSSLMQTESKKLFEIGKVAAIGEAIVSTISAAVHAYEGMIKVFPGPVGMAAGAAAATAATIAGAVRVQQIGNTQYGSKSVPGGVATAAAPAQTVQPINNVQQTTVNATLVGDNFSAEQVRGFAGVVSEASSDGVKFNFG